MSLEKFGLWVSKNTEYKVIINENKLTTSMVVEVENASYIGRFTLWDDLSCISEIIDINTGLYPLNRREEFTSFDELLSIFKRFLRYLNISN